MPDEFIPAENGQKAENDGGDPEVPSLAESHPPSPKKYDPSQYAERAAHYVHVAYEQVVAVVYWLKKWVTRAILSANFWIAVATIAIAISTGIYTYYAGKQWDVMSGQLNEMVNQSRPWMKISSVDLRPGIGPIKTLMFHWVLTGAEIPPNLQIKISMLNVGHSPAQGVETIPELFFHKFENQKWHDIVIGEQQRFCKSVISQAPSAAASIVFPSDPLETNMVPGGIIRDADITRESDNPTRYSAAALILCVNYNGGGKTVYQTQAWLGCTRTIAS